MPDVCPDCGEKNWTFYLQDGEEIDIPRECKCRREMRVEREERQRKIDAQNNQDKVQNLFDRSMMSTRFKERTFENFKCYNDSLSFAYSTVKKYATNFDNVKYKPQNSLIITGDVGTGKTHLAAAIANFLIKREVPTIFATMADFLQRIREGFDDGSNVLKELQTVPFLVIDDLGKENESRWVAEQVYQIINPRYENNLPTVITTQFTGKVLRAKLDSAVVSRLTESYFPIKIEADDYRMKRSK